MSAPHAARAPEEVEQLLRRLRLPHMRRIAGEVLATAKVQRWEPAEVLRALLTEEVAGRERSALGTRRAAASFPTGKTFQAWDPSCSSIPLPTQNALRSLDWIRRRECLVVCGRSPCQILWKFPSSKRAGPRRRRPPEVAVGWPAAAGH